MLCRFEEFRGYHKKKRARWRERKYLNLRHLFTLALTLSRPFREKTKCNLQPVAGAGLSQRADPKLASRTWQEVMESFLSGHHSYC